MPESEQIMTLADVAQYLKIAEKSVLRMVRRGELPATKVASQWRFFRSVIDEWLRARMHPDAHPPSNSSDVSLSRMLSEAACLLDLTPGDKPTMLAQLAAPLAALEGRESSAPLVDRLLHREEMVSTGIGHGIAIPHLRNPLEMRPRTPHLIFGRCSHGVDFDAIDGEPVTLFFLPRPADDIHHVKVMARLGSLLRVAETRNALEHANTYRDVETIFLAHDQKAILAP